MQGLAHVSTGRSDTVSTLNTIALISAISNIVLGLIWAATCFGIIFSIPMWILCVFEFIHYGKVDELDPHDYVNKSKTLAMFQIAVGLFNTVALVCGIVAIIRANKYLRTGR